MFAPSRSRRRGHRYQKIRAEIRAWSSNNILSEVDQRIIRGLLVEVQHDINNIDAKILANQALIETLQRRRTGEVARMEHLRIGIAGHKKLPSHVLAAIFVLCHKADRELLPCGRTSASWSLSQVCVRWRQVALAEPLLWNRLHASPNFSSSEPATDVIHDVLSRRGGLGPIEFHVKPGCPDDWKTTFDLISTYPSRLRSLWLTLNAPPSPYFDAPIAALNTLESLRISTRYPCRGVGGPVPAPIVAFSHAHALRKVSFVSAIVGGMFSASWSQFMVFPWHQLTDLEILPITPRITLEILAQCSRIVNLSVTFSRHDPPCNNVAFNRVPLPHLRYLSITPTYDTSLPEFLNALALSTLEKLAFGHGLRRPWPQQVVLGLLASSSHVMKSLALNSSSCVVPGDGVLPLMRALPHLIVLELPTYDPVPQLDFITMNSESLVPKLRAFKGCGVSSIRHALDFLRARWSRDAHGRYEGISVAELRIKQAHFALDLEYAECALLEAQRDGRIIEVKKY